MEAGVELALQVATGAMPRPDRIVLPLGTGGTAAGLALGTAIGGLRTEIVGVRVVPRIVANRAHVLRLASRTARLIRLTADGPLRPDVPAPAPVRVVQDFYGGAYGRPTAEAQRAAERLEANHGITADTTYAAKALAAAIAIAEHEGGTTLFWLTFDGRWLRDSRLGARD
jgi:D-cysteine desulfhydrase